MTQDIPKRQPALRDLGDGLVLRRSTPADTDALAAFNADIHREQDAEEPEDRIAVWTRDLMQGDHPTFDPGDFTIVEDTRIDTIVSACAWISQTWSYDGIEFGVGRPELVGTHPDYRRRGLVRAQFDVMHTWSAEHGEKLQAITGIPWFYRQFGYEMGLSLGGGRIGYALHVPKLEGNEGEPYRVRPATESDLPFIIQVYEQRVQRYRITCVRNKAIWRYELLGKRERSLNRLELRVVESVDGEPVGFLAHQPWTWEAHLSAVVYELKSGASWLAVTPSVVRYLWDTGKAYAERDDKEAFGAFGFWLGTEHPVYQVISERLPRTRDPYAWYVRVPDMPDFVRHVAPALERRLAESIVTGHTGELKISFYRSGLRIVLESGKVTEVKPWAPARGEADAAFPDLTFLQLLFGYRSLEKLEYAFADCWVENDEVRVVLNALFPKQTSDVWPVT